MIDGETKPPPLLTEADLIGLMEKHGKEDSHLTKELTAALHNLVQKYYME